MNKKLGEICGGVFWEIKEDSGGQIYYIFYKSFKELIKIILKY